MGGIAPRSSCPGGESHSSLGRSRSSAQYEINNSIAKIRCPTARFLGVLFFSAGGGAVVSLRP